MKRVIVFLITAAVMCTVATPAAAGNSGWHFRVFAAGFDPDLDVVVPAENPDEIRVRADSDLGFGASLEYQFNNLLGLEAGLVKASPAIELIADDVPGYGDIVLSDSMSTTALMLDLNFHLTPSSEYFDLYVGGGIARMNYGDLQYEEPDGDALDLGVANDTGFSAKAGLGISFGRNSNWAAFGAVRYIWTDVEVTEEDTVSFDFDTFSFSVGIAVSF
jgi:hypothetical protein